MDAASLKKVVFCYSGGSAMRFDFGVAAGERLAIMGASGSGKSTLLHLLAGFETPVSGSIQFTNIDLTYAEPADRPVSILFQDNNLFGHLTIAQNISLGIGARLRLSKADTERVDIALAKVGLSGLGKRLPSELSGGERQRAALARCLLRDKPVLLLDEPFAALGPGMRIQMLNLVLALQLEKSLSIIMVTHNPDDAAYFATRVGFVENGQLSATMHVDILHNLPKNSALAVYLGAKQVNS
jgi:thiamine transport system ATP-binding protein